MKYTNQTNAPDKSRSSFQAAACWFIVIAVLASFLLAVMLIPRSRASEPAVSEPPAKAAKPAGPEQIIRPAQNTIGAKVVVSSLDEILDEEQLALYAAAQNVYLHLFGGDTDEVNELNADRHYSSKWETVEIDGMRYTKSWGPYANYTDFDALIRSVFTPRFWAERNTPDGIETFINLDGVLCYISAARGSGNYNENFPDKYRLDSKSDDLVTFTVIGHYSERYLLPDESCAERDLRVKSSYEYTVEFPIRMERTEDGWRVDQFYAAITDEERFVAIPAAAAITSVSTQVNNTAAQLGVYPDHDGSYRFVLTNGNRQTEFTDLFDSAMALTLSGTDLDGDGEEEIVITYCLGHGTGMYDGTLRVFDAITMMEYDCSEVTDMVIGQISSTGDADHFYLQADGLDVTILRKELGSDEFNRMYDAILFGDYCSFEVAGGKLYCHLAAEYREYLVYCGKVTAELRLENGVLVCGSFDFEDQAV